MLDFVVPNPVNVNIAQFEIIAGPIAPGDNVPYVQQGFFVQLFNVVNAPANIELIYYSLPFIFPTGIAFGANYIIGNSPIVDFTTQFLAVPNQPAFYLTVPGNATVLFGIEVLVDATQSKNKRGTTPQEEFGARGVVALKRPADCPCGILPTVRQSFTTFNSDGTPAGSSQSAYSVPFYTAF